MKVQTTTGFRSVKILVLTMAGVMMSIPAFAQKGDYSQRDSFPVPTPPAPLDDETQLDENTTTQPMLKSRPMLKPVPQMRSRAVEQSAYIVPPPGNIRELSLIYLPEQEPHEFKEGDLIEVIVDEKGNTTSKSLFNRQRNGSFKAELKEWIRLGKDGNLRPAAEDSPTIDTNLTSRLQSNGQINDSEGMNFRIGVVIEEVKPNGNLVIAGHKEIVYNKEVWTYDVHGTIRKDDVSRDNTILSSKITNGGVRKDTKGKVYDSTKRPWGIRLKDLLSPF